MMDTITIKEYDSLLVKDKRDVKNKVISKDDAIALQGIILENEPIFHWGYKRITAQQWVGTISLKDLNIEILPKLSGYVNVNELRDVLTRMLLVSHQSPYLRETPGNVQARKDSLIEMIIETFLNSLERYLVGGMQHSYRKLDKNINKVKGQILFNKQFSRNVLKVDRFWCKYSKFTPDNKINQFFKLCLLSMQMVTKDNHNKGRIKYLLPVFDDISNINKDSALSKPIVFNSTNHRAQEAYQYGKLFLQNIYSTLNAGNVKINMMLFDMNSLYEMFIFKSAKAIYRGKVSYQQRRAYALQRDSDNRKFISLRPDLIIKRDDGSIDIVDTKWKIPQNFAKESDVYQMNTYSTSIEGADRILLLYPYVNKNAIVDDYHFIDKNGNERQLKIRTVDLLKCLDWKGFLGELEKVLD